MNKKSEQTSDTIMPAPLLKASIQLPQLRVEPLQALQQEKCSAADAQRLKAVEASLRCCYSELMAPR